MIIGRVFLNDSIEIISENVETTSYRSNDGLLIMSKFKSGSMMFNKEKVISILKQIDKKDLEEILGELKKWKK